MAKKTYVQPYNRKQVNVKKAAPSGHVKVQVSKGMVRVSGYVKKSK